MGGGDHPLGLFYLLFLPLIWIATRHGLIAASWAVLTIQIGLIAGLEIQDHPEAALRAFQLLMLALAATGLMLGAVVSERRRLALALVGSESRRTAILNTARDGVLTIDARGNIQSVNPAVERLLGQKPEELIGTSVSTFIPSEERPKHESMLQRKLEGEGSTRYETQIQSRDGRRLTLEVNSKLIKDRDGRPVAIHSISRDVTERKEAEERLKHSKGNVRKAIRGSTRSLRTNG